MGRSRPIDWFVLARRVVLASTISTIAAAAIVLLPVGPFAGSACAGSGPNQASLVVEHGNGSTLRRCVAFSSSTITGDQLLAQSGIEYATATYGGFGLAICQIDNEPAHFSTCLPPSPEPYWAMFVSRAGGPWAVSNLGISSQTFADGDAEGFRYDPQTGTPAPPPLPVPCPSSTPILTAAATLRPAATPRPTPTPTPNPSPTALPEPTADTTPDATPDPTPTPAAGPTSSELPPSPVASAPAPVMSDTERMAGESAPPANLIPPASAGDLATPGALLALLVLLIVAIAAARSRPRQTGR